MLRVAAAWGTTILGVRMLERGHDCVLGETPRALAPLPDGLKASAVPLRANAGGWELDARGAISGHLMLRGRAEDVAGLAAAAPKADLDAGVVESRTLDGGTRVFKFSELDIEGRLKSPQLVYFLRRVRAEFAAGDLGHRTFLPEMSETRKESSC